MESEVVKREPVGSHINNGVLEALGNTYFFDFCQICWEQGVAGADEAVQRREQGRRQEGV
jgi:hypothetical protein